MTPHQISLVRTSWDKVYPIAETVAGLFYRKLFELEPEFKKLFPSEMKQQGKKLMTMINVAVRSLDKLDSVLSAIQASGKRHVSYGVKNEDYATVGKALLWTLEQGLGDEFTDDVKQAWIEAYELFATTMKEAAKDEAA